MQSMWEILLKASPGSTVYTVTKKLGPYSYVVQLENGHEVWKHEDHVRSCVKPAQEAVPACSTQSPLMDEEFDLVGETSPSVAIQPGSTKPG